MTNLLMAAGAGFYFANIKEDEPLTLVVCIVLAASAVFGHFWDRREERNHG
jgi:hypothetical protein